MKFRSLCFGAAIVFTTAAVTTQVVSQQDKGNAPQQAPGQDEMMAKWMAFMTPGEHHKQLDFKVGKWNGEVKHWMDPNMDPEASPATAEYKWIMDGRYLHNELVGEFGGTQFRGQSWEGYDNLKKKYGSVWIDNMGTGFMHAEGTFDTASKTFKYTFDQPDVIAGKYVKGRSVERVIDNDHFVLEMYGPGPDGKEYKTLEITYTRAK